MTHTTYHIVHYRRFRNENETLQAANFADLFRQALDSADSRNQSLWTRPNDRLYQVSDEDRYIALNKVADLSSAIVAELFLFQNRDSQAILNRSIKRIKLSNITDVGVFDLDERILPEGSHFIRGMAYCIAIGDHFFAVKTNQMTFGVIEDYFHWLLRQQTKICSPNFKFALQAEFDRTQIAGDIGDIQSLRLTGNASGRLQIQAKGQTAKHDAVPTSRKIADRLLFSEHALSFINIFFGKATATSLMESLGPEEYLSVDAKIKVRGRRTEETKAHLRTLASELANLSDGSVHVEGKDGRISDGDAILRTRMPFQLAHEGSSLLDFYNVADQLQEVYHRFVKDGKIASL